MSDATFPGVIALGGGRFALSDGDRQRLAYAAVSGGAVWVFVDGRVFHVRAGAPSGGRMASRGDDDTALAAPMPATVAAVLVAPDQPVAKGDVLITLEAMKMEMAIKAPRDGIVRRVACAPGELVSPGVPLVELE